MAGAQELPARLWLIPKRAHSPSAASSFFAKRGTCLHWKLLSKLVSWSMDL